MMKYICRGCIEADKLETMSKRKRNGMVEERFPYDEMVRRTGHIVDGERVQSAQNAATLRFQHGKVLKRIRANLPLTPIPTSTALTRAYFRAMRAAEMAAWEMTGGDYLLSSCVAQV